MGLFYTFFVIPVILPFYFWDKTRQERLIAASEVNWVVVQARRPDKWREAWPLSSWPDRWKPPVDRTDFPS